MALDTIYDVMDILAELKEKKKKISEYEKKLEEDSEKYNELELQVKDFSLEVKSYVKKIKKWIEIRLIPLNNRFELVNDLLLYNSKISKIAEYNYKNYQEVFNDGSDILEKIANKLLKSPLYPKGKEVIYSFLVCFNTLSMISNEVEVLGEDYLNSNGKIEMLKLKSNYENLKLELKKDTEIISEYFEKDFNIKNLDTVNFGNGYNDKILIGYHQDNSLEKGDIEVIGEFLDIESPLLSQTVPTFFELDKIQKPILIRYPKKEINEDIIINLLNRLLLRFIASVPIDKIRIAEVINPEISDNVIDEVILKVMKLCDDHFIKPNDLFFDSNLTFTKEDKDKNDNAKTIEGIINFIENRRNKYDNFNKENYGKIKSRNNFYDYNKINIDNQDYLLLVLIDSSLGLIDDKKLNLILNSLDAGVVPIILQDSKLENNYCFDFNIIDNIKKLENKALKDNNYCFDYNGINNILLSINDQLDNNYFNNIKINLLESKKLNLSKVLKKIKNDKLVYSADEKSFRIPFGISNDKVLDLLISNDKISHGILLGEKGSGKTSLLKSIILGAASIYSPDEIEFYLIDYDKYSDHNSLSVFKKDDAIVIPHIKYLSLKTNKDATLDLLNMISSMHDERMKLINSNGYTDVYHYNSSENVKKGNPKTPKLSKICFIIDEYEKMFDDSIGDLAYDKFSSLINNIRTSGIFILISGNSDIRIKDEDLNLISKKIIMKGSSINNSQSFFGKIPGENIYDYLDEEGKVALIYNEGKNFALGCVGYSGSEGNVLINSLVKDIQKNNNKYPLSEKLVINNRLTNKLINISSDGNFEKNTLNTLNNGYSLYIGLYSHTFKPVAIRYSNNKNSSNYFACGGKYHTDIIKQNVMFSFLYSTSINNKYDTYRIYDLNFNNNSCLDKYVTDYPYLKNHIQSVTDSYENEKIILDLYRKLKNGEKISNPILLVVSQVSELRINKDDNYYHKQIIETLKENKLSYSDDEINKLTKELLKSNEVIIDKSPNLIKSNNVHNNKIVSEALKDLYLEGYMSNIFVLLVDSNYKLLDYFVKDNDKSLMYSICDRKDTVDVSSDAYDINYFHVRSDEIIDSKVSKVDCKAKLYNYQGEINKPWWDNLERLLKNK